MADQDDDQAGDVRRPSSIPLQATSSTVPQLTSAEWTETVVKPAIHNFFYPTNSEPPRSTLAPGLGHTSSNEDDTFVAVEEEDRRFIKHFWRVYDDIIILSLFTQIGIVFRLASSTWFTFFDGVFSNDSALFVNLPLNSLSCFLMGLLCSGERLMEMISTRFSPPRLQSDLVPPAPEDPDDEVEQEMLLEEDPDDSSSSRRRSSTLRRRRQRRRKRQSAATPPRQEYFYSWQPPVHLNEELRDVQLLALERRIRASKCLVLFPVRKEDVDVMEHYFATGYKREDFDLTLDEEEGDEDDDALSPLSTMSSADSASPQALRSRDTQRSPQASHDEDENLAEVALHENHTNGHAPASPLTTSQTSPAPTTPDNHENNGEESNHGDTPEQPNQVDQMIQDVHANVTENISRLRRINLADGWDVGTTAEDMSDDLMLGLRDGFCGAVSSFSSWTSAMYTLMRAGNVGEAFVGYMLGLQLPIIAYRFGQHVAVYIFMWRCRREARSDERRGYGIRLSMQEHSERDLDDEEEGGGHAPGGPIDNGDGLLKTSTNRDTPSVRAIATALFIMALVTQCTSLSFFQDSSNRQLALSLLFSPLGVLARWRLSKLNQWRPTFPIGTFTANILACALSGGLGSLLAGNPGNNERIVLVSVVNGFGGTLSSLATFIVEILAGIDPILFRFDGVIYAVMSIFWATVVGFIFSASVDWADQTGAQQAIVGDDLNITDDALNGTRWF